MLLILGTGWYLDGSWNRDDLMCHRPTARQNAMGEGKMKNIEALKPIGVYVG